MTAGQPGKAGSRHVAFRFPPEEVTVFPTLRIAAGAIAASTSVAGLVAPVTAEQPARTVSDVRTVAGLASAMTLPQRVGQLFMVGTPATGASKATLRAISRYHAGNVILTGRSYGGVRATAKVAAALRSRVTSDSTAGVGLFIATDQEGGYVQVLNGKGFSDMPTGLAQGRLAAATLRADAATWGAQLRRAGVNLDLAPVADTVPSPEAARHNPPIGYWKREYGFTTRRVGRHATAFVRGMADSGVSTTAKHFPGLGRVHANTDTSSGVTDRVTVRHDAYFGPFQRTVDAGVPFVMMSTAYYRRIDPKNPAAFSPFIVGTILRGDLGFTGVVISDSLDARQVLGWRPGRRAVKFFRAGGDMALVTNPKVLPVMYQAVLDRARASASFRTRLDHAVLRVLLAKKHRHLLGG
ncbi:MAG TPA: glycoside hydrolase family 3 N-terminal domain-containing protein [Marmoricola sp.]|nr:glycoside hydrolase family 3 N-terminal domain-containing protein [Marmoricola sp.]